MVAIALEGTFTGVGTRTGIVEASRKYAPKLRGKRAKAIL
jgi:hypothetical protein